MNNWTTIEDIKVWGTKQLSFGSQRGNGKSLMHGDLIGKSPINAPFSIVAVEYRLSTGWVPEGTKAVVSPGSMPIQTIQRQEADNFPITRLAPRRTLVVPDLFLLGRNLRIAGSRECGLGPGKMMKWTFGFLVTNIWLIWDNPTLFYPTFEIVYTNMVWNRG